MELGAKVAITSRDLEAKKTASELESETGGTCLPYNVTFVTMMK
jgi:hypothetical protein